MHGDASCGLRASHEQRACQAGRSLGRESAPIWPHPGSAAATDPGGSACRLGPMIAPRVIAVSVVVIACHRPDAVDPSPTGLVDAGPRDAEGRRADVPPADAQATL